MTSWRNSPSKKISLKQRLLSTQEFNFSNKFLWRLPGINNKFKSLSPIFAPMESSSTHQRFSKIFFSSGTIKEIEIVPDQTKPAKITKKPHAQLLITGIPKLREKPYFRKTFLAKIFPSKVQKKKAKNLSLDDYNINGWGQGEKSKILLT